MAQTGTRIALGDFGSTPHALALRPMARSLSMARHTHCEPELIGVTLVKERVSQRYPEDEPNDISTNSF
jgi:hypothetical protein